MDLRTETVRRGGQPLASSRGYRAEQSHSRPAGAGRLSRAGETPAGPAAYGPCAELGRLGLKGDQRYLHCLHCTRRGGATLQRPRGDLANFL